MNKKPQCFFIWGLAASLLLNVPIFKAAKAQSVDPGVSGPFSVSQVEYDLGDKAFTPPGFPGPVEVLASVHYPTNLSAGPFPLIVLLHGRHATCFDSSAFFLEWPCPSASSSIPSYQGYDYIAQILASHGYIVTSLSANGINAQDSMSSDLGALARAQLIQHHLQLWNTFNTTGAVPLGNLFIGAVDLNNIGTMGHSRGGEGIVRHFIFNANQNPQFGIKAVFPLAPTNFSRNIINNVPLAVMLPYCDGDVSDLQGVHYFDDALYNVPGDLSPKQTILVMGANHNFYNTIWTPSIFPQGSRDDWQFSADSHCGTVPGNQRLTAAQQRGSGLAYIVGFFRRYLGGELEFNSMFTGDTLPPASAMTSNIFVTFHAPDDPSLRRDINRIVDANNLTSNTLGGAVTQNGLVPYDLCGGAAPLPRHCLNGEPTERQPHTVESFLAPTRRGLSQLRIGWNDPAAELVNELPTGSRDLTGFFALQFRVSVDFTNSRNPIGLVQNFSVSLTDGDGNTSSVDIADISLASRVLFYPPGTTSSVPKTLLNGLRIPLSAFIGVNLNDIRSIKFGFDRKLNGALLISDMAFTNTAGPVDVYFLVDLSGSFADDLPIFKASAPNIMSTLMGSNPDTRFGLGSYEDYPIPPFGDAPSGDVAYRQDIDLTFDTTAVETVINGLITRFGSDAPESQLPALFQAATGSGQDLSIVGFPGASIPPGQQVNFRDDVTKLFLLWTDASFHRPGDPGTIPYPGPSFSQTVDAILALDPPKVIGISSGGGGMEDLEAIATATDAFAPPGGVDCDNDGNIDLLEGDPLVCSIASSGAGISDAIISLVEAAAVPTEVQVTIDIKPQSKRNRINIKRRRFIPVAIISTNTFDASLVDPRTVSFGPKGAPARKRVRIKDVDDDGNDDIVLRFRTRKTGIACGDTTVSLTGKTFDNKTIKGSDSIKTVGCKKKKHRKGDDEGERAEDNIGNENASAAL